MFAEAMPNDKVLFVEDDPDISSSILLEMSGSDFDIFMAGDPEQALQVLSSTKIDLVACSMEMSEGEGAGFLSMVKEKYPNTHRVVMNSDAHEAEAAGVIARGYATANIAKPWEEDLLKVSIEHILSVRQTLKQKRLLESINEIDQLPSLPAIYQKFTQAVLEERPIREIGLIIEDDVSLATRILQIANSAFFGSAAIASVDQAVMRLGLNTVKDLVLTFSFVNELEWSQTQLDHLQAIFTHSSLVNRFLRKAYQLMHGAPLSLDMSSIGITHDIGKVITLQYFQDRYEAILEHQEEHPGYTFFDSEEALGFNWFRHHEVGAYFLNMWNLPDAVVETTLFHHIPQEAGEDVKPMVESLAFVNDLVSQLELIDADEEINPSKIPQGVISEMDLEDLIAEIRREMK